MLKLIEPTMEYEKEIQVFRQDFLAHTGSMDGCGSLRRFDNIQEWIDQISQLKCTETTPAHLVPMTQYICVREEDRKLGTVECLRKQYMSLRRMFTWRDIGFIYETFSLKCFLIGYIMFELWFLFSTCPLSYLFICRFMFDTADLFAT